MKINKEALKALSEKNDSDLWREITMIAESHGYKLPQAMPKHEDMEKIRGAMRGTEKLNLQDAARLINTYKKK